MLRLIGASAGTRIHSLQTSEVITQALLFNAESQQPFCCLETLPPCETLVPPPLPSPRSVSPLICSHVFSLEKEK